MRKIHIKEEQLLELRNTLNETDASTNGNGVVNIETNGQQATVNGNAVGSQSNVPQNKVDGAISTLGLPKGGVSDNSPAGKALNAIGGIVNGVTNEDKRPFVTKRMLREMRNNRISERTITKKQISEMIKNRANEKHLNK